MPHQDNDLKLLINKRGNVKSKLTRFKTFLDALDSNEDLPLEQIKLRLEKAEECWSEFEDLQLQIETLDSITDHSADREQFENQYFELISTAKKHLKPKQVVQNTYDRSSPSNVSVSDTTTIAVKLPTINLPSFTGNYEDWIPFSDSFKALIHQNEALSDIQKFHYLRSSLKGEAVQVIKALDLTSSNYPVAWNLLEARYQNKRLIVQRHVKSLFDLPSNDKETAQGLRQLLDGTLTHMRALKSLGQPTENWDTLVIHLVSSKLNPSTYREWENITQPDQLPTLKNLTDFLQRRCQIIETSQSHKPHSTLNNKFKPSQNTCALAQTLSCRICKKPHETYQCQELLKASQAEQYKKLKYAGLCYNCLRPGHTTQNCFSSGCRICHKKHNTALHRNANLRNEPKEITANISSTSTPTDSIVKVHTATSTPNESTSEVLLSTAVVDVIGPNGKTIACRALLDNGSQSCFLTEHICQLLGLPRSRNCIQVAAINNSHVNSKGSTVATVRSKITNYSANLEFIVIPKITGDLPRDRIDLDVLKLPKHIALADPQFGHPGKIDILLGQEIFLEILCIGQLKLKGCPILQKTKLGWIAGGRLKNSSTSKNEPTCLLTTTEKISNQLQNFWKLEEPSFKIHLTAEETRCEELYKMNTKRSETGRYIVKMPLRETPRVLGNSKELAVKRLESVERRLARNHELSSNYKEFMSEYIRLGHMEEVTSQEHHETEYFLPHHPVIKEDSSTTKVRVVFDASAKTTSGKSLNDIQLVGPVVQSDLFSVLLRFRTYTYVMKADLEKMYRQIEIDDSQRSLLQIVWREDSSMPIKLFKLNTVTYGTSSAPFLATRTLNQLAVDEGSLFPKAADVLKQNFYVDDLLTGTNTIEEGLKLQEELIQLLSKGHFNLRKWNANTEHLLEHLPDSLLEREPQEFSTSGDCTKKTLGLWWDSTKDEFQYKHLSNKANKPITKRSILSEIARLFDPLGLLSPVIVRAKMLLQDLWKLKLGWDESLPMNIQTQWHQFVRCLDDLNYIKIKRQATLPCTDVGYELHGFCDASEKGFGAAVYLKHQDPNGFVKVSLLCFKSRVAPLKTVSLPRLELCAAVLLSELVLRVKDSLKLHSDAITLWTDSMVVLAWINAEPARWVTFVANRVSKIQEETQKIQWRHVGTTENPADLISRGAMANTLKDSSLWWEGPEWLKTSREEWPTYKAGNETSDVPEEKPSYSSACLHNVQEPSCNSVQMEIINKFSTFSKSVRVIGYVLRFIQNLKGTKEKRVSGPLSAEELKNARVKILHHIQREEFSAEIKELEKIGTISKGHLASLAPFLDHDGLIRVGGRLDRSCLDYETRHQILLPKCHKMTESIAEEEHVRQLHCGPQALLYALRQQYWPINGRDLVRKITHKCVRCFKVKPKLSNQMMGDLPASRVNPGRAFVHTGVDYCGPFQIKQSKRRNAAITKCYVAVFVCLATKAVHVELVSNLTTEAFIAALRRFIARRGIPKRMSSDNGKTFVGANRELQDLKKFLANESQLIVETAAKEGITWEFIPPYSPHMGGLWEAAVKSMKRHLKRTVGNASLTFEELNTILTQVEAVLNSRPLYPMSNDPSDPSVLTPSHFLTGGSLMHLPEPSLAELPERQLSRWQRLQQLLHHFWSRWSKEYLCSLQQRHKWKTPAAGLSVGTLVLMKEDNSPPLTWRLGRITSLHPGKDGLVRVVTIKTVSGEVTRNVHKLCPLPLEQ